jgi:hypothetical protein
MTKFTVYKILIEGSRSLLLVNSGDDFSLSVYDEKTGNTILRMTKPTLENFERAIAILKGDIDKGDF